MSPQWLLETIKNIYGSSPSVPLHEPCIDKQDEEYVLDALKSGFVSTAGEYVNKFENKLAEYSNSKNCIATVNGTSSLHLALKVAGVSEGTIVITQSLTFVATTNAIKYCKAFPMFIDVSKKTYGMCPLALETFLKTECKIIEKKCFHNATGRQISAILPMHTFGMPCDIISIVNLASEWNIKVVEDAAEALGSFINGKMCGTFGDLGVLSFNGNKLITSGGGGAVITAADDLAQKVRHLSTTAKVSHPYEFIHDSVGFNYRMPNLCAALGYSQILKIKNLLAQKKELKLYYLQKAKEAGLNLNFLSPAEGVEHNHWLFAIKFENQIERDECLDVLLAAGINVRIPWRPNHLLNHLNSNFEYHLPNTMDIYNTVMNIPSSPWSYTDAKFD